MPWSNVSIDECHIISDFSPENNTRINENELNSDFLLISSNPGQSTRIESSLRAAYTQHNSGIDCLATLTLRDLSPLAIRSMILGLLMWKVKGAVVLAGDPPKSPNAKSLHDRSHRTTTMIKELQTLLKENSIERDAFKLGSVIDLGDSLENAVKLTCSKLENGVDFFVTQPVFSVAKIHEFESMLFDSIKRPLETRIYYGLQLLRQGSISFTDIPYAIQEEVAAGLDNTESLTEMASLLMSSGHRSFYTVAPIFPGGKRDYDICKSFNTTLKSMYQGTQGAGAD